MSETRDWKVALEDEMCTCGAGHGSLEGHLDWCDYRDRSDSGPSKEGEGDGTMPDMP